jgi:MFS family permease
VLGSIAFLGALYLAALFFQDGLGLSALQSGLTVFPQALGVMAGSQVVTRVLYPRFGPRRIMVGGLLIVTGMLVLMAQVTADADPPCWRPSAPPGSSRPRHRQTWRPTAAASSPPPRGSGDASRGAGARRDAVN